MKLWQSLLVVLTCLGVLALAIWGAFRLILHLLSGLEQDTQTATIGAIALLSVPLVTYFTTKAIERRRSVEQTLRLKKVELYQSFIEFFMTILLNGTKPKPTDDDMVDFLVEITPRIITYGSNDVIKQWGKYRVNLDRLVKAKDPKALMKPLEDLLKAMRKDLGHGGFGLAEGDISRLFINDIDDYLSKDKAKSN